MSKRYLTLQDLCSFYQNHFSSNTVFNASEAGGPVVVQAYDIGDMETSKIHDGLMFLKFKVCHIDINRNGSRITEENMTKAMPSLKYRPVLAYIIENKNCEPDFDSHNIAIDDDGNTTYEEAQVGSFTEGQPFLEYDEEQDKTYVIAYAAIPVDYTKTAEILERKNGTKVSCELCINQMSYDAKEKVLDITDFYFNGVTLLGEHVEEGMLGSRADIASLSDFTAQENSVFEDRVTNENIVKMLEDIKKKLSDLNINTNFEKGGVDSMKLEELLEKYNKTVDDLDFDYENMSDEELETKFEELFGEKEPENPDDPEVSDPDSEDFKKKRKRCSIEINDKTYSIELSLDEKMRALESLVNEVYSEQDNAYYCVKVYDDYVIMIDYWSGRAYKQSYKSENDVYSLTDDRVEVYATYLTEEESNVLNDLKTNYQNALSELNSYKSAEEQAKKDNIIASEDYAVIRESAEFSELIKKSKNMSSDELLTNCDQLLLNHIKTSNKNFSATSKKRVRIGANIPEEEKNIPYATLRRK